MPALANTLQHLHGRNDERSNGRGQGVTEGVKVGAGLTSALRFADDQAMIAASQ